MHNLLTRRGLIFKIFLFVIFALACLVVLVAEAHAQQSLIDSAIPIFQQEICNDGPGYCTLCDLLYTIKRGINFVFLLLTPIVAGVTIYGGIVIATSAGNPAKFQTGVKAITAGLIGAAIVFGAWIIVNTTINVVTGNNFTATGFWSVISCDEGTLGAAPPPAPPAGPPPPPPTQPPPGLRCSADRNSPELDALVNCIRNTAAGQGLTLTGTVYTFQGRHTCRLDLNPPNISCHFGGRNCNGVAHAADLALLPSQRNPVNWERLRRIGSACAARDSRCEMGSEPFITVCTNPAVNHIHVNDLVNCGCT